MHISNDQIPEPMRLTPAILPQLIAIHSMIMIMQHEPPPPAAHAPTRSAMRRTTPPATVTPTHINIAIRILLPIKHSLHWPHCNADEPSAPHFLDDELAVVP